MKSPVLIILLAASMLIIPAASGQANPKTVSHPPATTARFAPAAQRFNLNGTWQFNYNGQPMQVKFQQSGDQFKSFTGIGNLGRSDALLFEGRYIGGVIVGQRIRPQNTRVSDTLTVVDPDHVRIFLNGGVIITHIASSGG